MNKTAGKVTGHYTSMINPKYTYTGLMTFQGDAGGYKYTSQEFNSTTTALDDSEVGKTGKYSQIIEVEPSVYNYDISGVAKIQPEGTTTYDVTIMKGENKVTNVSIKTPIVWSSSNTGVATIDSSTGELTGKSNGTTTVTAKANNVTLATKEVTVSEREVSSIAVTTKPAKLEYVVGQSNNVTGGKITVTYDDEDTEVIDITSSMVSGFDSSAVADDQELTVTYGGKTATYNVDIVAKKVTSIEVTTNPTNTSYIEGQDIDVTGGKITATYNDGDTKEVNMTSSMLSGYEKNTIGSQDVTVTYEGETDTFEVTVSEKEVLSIAVTTKPAKLEYVVGQSNDVTEGKITVTYNNGDTSVVDITSSMVSGFDSSAVADDQELTVTYGGKTAAYNVDIVAKKVTSIEVTTNPTNTSYIEGQDIDVTGGKITATYNDGDTKEVNMTSSMLSGYEKNTIGSQDVTVTYEGETDTFEVTVLAKTVTGITVKKSPTKTVYVEGQDFDSTGGVIEVSYDNGTTSEVTLTNDMVVGYDKTKLGDQKLTVKYAGKTTELSVKVNAKSVNSIDITTEPTKVSYVEGQELSIAGGKIEVTYDNGAKESIDITNDMVSGYDKNTTGEQTITITYGGKTDTYSVNVVQKVATKLVMKTNPAKVQYIINQPFKIDGATVEVTYNDETKEIVTVTDEMFTEPDTSTLGDKVVNVTYKGQTTSFNVKVVDKALTSIAVTTKPTKLTYKEGETLTSTGGVITLTYDNGTTETVNMTDAMCAADMNKTGDQNVIVTYNGKTATYGIKVNAKIAVSTEWVNQPTITSVVEGKKYPFSGKVKITYDTGVTEIVDVTSDLFEVEDYNTNSIGKQDVRIRLKGSTFELPAEITVEEKVPSGIIFNKTPSQTFTVGDKFSVKGLEVLLTYSNANSDLLPLTDLIISQPDMNKVGEQTITIKYGDYELTYKITIKKATNNVASNNSNSNNGVNTGDDTNILLYVFMLLLGSSYIFRQIKKSLS